MKSNRWHRPLTFAALLTLLTACKPKPVVQEAIDNVELRHIVEADQKDRELPAGKINWAIVNPRDQDRRRQLKKLLATGNVQTGKDFERAALVFQHGDGSDDILLAHILAVTALGKGDSSARKLGAMTLDRYLHRIKQPQVFGTQFITPDLQQSSKWTLEPYRTDLVSDALREANCVEPLQMQKQMLHSIQEGVEPNQPKQRCQ